MELKTIISKQPKCKTCGKLMLEWNPFANEHEHVECIANRISSSLIEIVKKHLKNKHLQIKTIIWSHTL